MIKTSHTLLLKFKKRLSYEYSFVFLNKVLYTFFEFQNKIICLNKGELINYSS